MEEMRLQKFLALAGVASRRKAEELISRGMVSVNGERVTEMGKKVSETDTVLVEGKKVSLETRKVYLMLNKPTGYVSTVKDQFGRPSVVDLVKDIGERIYPVGRLDYDTSGLLLLTNDGDFTYRITHPKHEKEKVYVAEVEGFPNEQDISRFRNGIRLDGYVAAPAKLKVVETLKDSSVVEITIHEGRNRQVRNMCEAVGHRVIRLKRVAIDGLRLEDLHEGKWRHLSGDEVKRLLGE